MLRFARNDESMVFHPSLGVGQRGYPGQLFAFQKLQGRAAAGREMVDTVAETQGVDGGERVTAPDYRVPCAGRQRLRMVSAFQRGHNPAAAVLGGDLYQALGDPGKVLIFQIKAGQGIEAMSVEAGMRPWS